MEDRIVNTHPIPELRKKTGPALVAYGLWLRVGFIGVLGFAAGALQLFDGEATTLQALALAVAGGVLAAIGWRRGRAALGAVGGAADPAAAAPEGAASRAPVTRPGARSMTAGAAPRPADQPGTS